MGRSFTTLVAAAIVGMLAAPALASASSTTQNPEFVPDVEGVYATPGTTEVRRFAGDRKIRIRTRGLAGEGDVACLSTACLDLGLDGRHVESRRKVDIVLVFEGAGGGGQAVVRGQSTGFIFTDGFESGDVSAVRGTADCTPDPAGGGSCDVVLNLKGRLRGDARGPIAQRLTGVVSFADGEASWGIIDWSGSLETRK